MSTFLEDRSEAAITQAIEANLWAYWRLFGRLPRAELHDAPDLLWVLTSLRSWEDLVLVRGWTAAQYEERIVAALLRLLTSTPALDRSGFSKRGAAASSQRR